MGLAPRVTRPGEGGGRRGEWHLLGVLIPALLYDIHQFLVKSFVASFSLSCPSPRFLALNIENDTP